MIIRQARDGLRPTSTAAAIASEVSPDQESLSDSTYFRPINNSQPATTSGTSVTSDLSIAPGSSDSEEEEADENSPPVAVILKCEDTDFNKISCIAVTRALRDGLALGTFSAKPQKNGELKVMVQDQAKVSSLLNLQTFLDRTVISVEEDVGGDRGPRNYVWGKIYSRELIECTDDEIQEELNQDRHNPPITIAKRIHRGKDRQRTSLIKIKFSCETLPRQVYCLGTVYTVTEFIPPVKKCYNCNTYNHHWTRDCGNPWVCQLCNKPDCGSVNGAACINPPYCKFCKSGHASSDRSCPKYLKEKEIVNVSFEKNISFNHARHKVESGTVSYATVAKMNKSSIPTNQPSTPRTSIKFNSVVKASIICNVADAATGFSDGLGTDNMGLEIDDKLANPGSLKVIIPSVIPETVPTEPNPETQREVEVLKEISSWAVNAPEEISTKFVALTRSFAINVEALRNQHPNPNNVHSSL